jgi:hypothetical protein
MLHFIWIFNVTLKPMMECYAVLSLRFENIELPEELTESIFHMCDMRSQESLGCASKAFNHLFNLMKIREQYAPELRGLLGGDKNILSFPVLEISDEDYKEIKRRFEFGTIYSAMFDKSANPNRIDRYVMKNPILPFFTIKRGDFKNPLIAFCTNRLDQGIIKTTFNLIPNTSFAPSINVDYLKRLLNREPAGILQYKYHYVFPYDETETQRLTIDNQSVVSMAQDDDPMDLEGPNTKRSM